MTQSTTLTPRQRAILRHLVEEYVSTGQPVGSKALVERAGLGVSPSTVRSELAELEALELLTHPHTSAGRVPTDLGYRAYADELLERMEPRPASLIFDLSSVRREVESALEATTEVLSQATRLLALVSAPSLESSTVRRVELILLQPHVVMIVVITSTGGVSKRIVPFDDRLDPGLINWAVDFLNERMAGLQLGSHQLRQQLDGAGSSPRERAFVDELRPAFNELLRPEQRLYVGGAAGLLDDARGEELGLYRQLLETLEKRAAMLEILGEALDARRPFVRLGGEFGRAALSDVALVGASYGLAHRTLGTVSLLGPVRMDYAKALSSVRTAALELSRFVEEVYEDN